MRVSSQGVWLAAAVVAAGCATQSPAPAAAPARCGSGPIFAAGSERATLWVRTSAEYRAASESTYRAAQAALAVGLADPSWTAEPAQTGDLSALPPAVVMDIDETVLDNSEPQVAMLRAGTCFEEFPAAWDAWIAKRKAPAIPGAAAFIRAAHGMKDPQGRPVHVVYVTNRECARRAGSNAACPQKDDTEANLRALGLGTRSLADEIMLKGERADWGSEKLPRRLEVGRHFRIVLNVGDDLADFIPDVRLAKVAERARARCARDDYWGRRWFVIPNPIYGSWLVALGPDLGSALSAAEAEGSQGCQDP